MHRKRKGSDLYHVSREGMCKRQTRKIESLEEKSARNETDAQRHAQHRAEKSDEEMSQRLLGDAQRHALQRANENYKEKSKRHEADAKRHAQQKQMKMKRQGLNDLK